MGSCERPAGRFRDDCLRMVAAAGVVLLTGCTMCPDPFDYTGPVPNGSSPQNNFRARSNGILPIGAAPVPWPPIVKGDVEGANDGGTLVAGRGAKRSKLGTPTLAETVVEQLGGTEDQATIAPVSVLVDAEPESSTGDEGEGAVQVVVPVLGEPADDEASAAEDVIEEPPAEMAPQADSTPTPAIGVSVELPSLAETPGWRPRRGR